MSARAIYPTDAAERLRTQAGKPYRPSNGSEGDYFMAAWCAGCRRRGGEANACRILVMSMGLGITDPEYPREWAYGSDGQPECAAFQDKHAPRPVLRCKATADLFPDPVNPPAKEA